MAILDGKSIPDANIDPAKHKFIGMFRAPFSSFMSGVGGYIKCDCGDCLQTYQETFDHWQRGHFDNPQYETILRKEMEGKA